MKLYSKIGIGILACASLAFISPALKPLFNPYNVLTGCAAETNLPYDYNQLALSIYSEAAKQESENK